MNAYLIFGRKTTEEPFAHIRYIQAETNEKEIVIPVLESIYSTNDNIDIFKVEEISGIIMVEDQLLTSFDTLKIELQDLTEEKNKHF